MIASSDALSLFPTLVWKAELRQEVYEAVNGDILGALEGQVPPERGLRRGQSWQSRQDLHTLSQFDRLLSCIDTTTKAVLAFLKVNHDAFKVTACWANINAPGARHRLHSHPNNLLSGVYYVQVQEGADTINFHDPRPQTGIIRPPVRELTAANTDLVVVRVSPGTLLLFPAWLPHSVDPNTSAGNRISISFNVMLLGADGDLHAPLWDGGLRNANE